MNFRTKHIPVRLTGMAVGVYTFDFRVAPHDLEMPESFEQPIVVHVQLDASHAQVLLTVDVETEATMPCDRCLDPVSVPVRTRFRLLYRHDEEVPVRDDDEDGEVRAIDMNEPVVDIAEDVRDAAVVCIPMRNICGEKDDGTPLCRTPIPGDRLLEAEERRDPRWDALRSLEL
jgi:uncharacterized protein